MKRVVGIVASVMMLAVGVGGAQGAVAKTIPSQGIVWGPCGKQPSLFNQVLGSFRKATEPAPPAPGTECATVRVPLDYSSPYGQTVKLALNRVKGRVSRDANHLGTLLVNPGGPGASGRELAEYVAATLPPSIADRYDVVGFDPRGVGNSEPALRCVDPDKYYAPPRPDHVPHSAAEENTLIGRAKEYADRCGNLWSWLLPYLTTENSARDMDTIRTALGEEKISYLGYSYGTYLGAVYATLFPSHLKRLVLDSTVDPKGVWYRANLEQDRSFDARHRDFLAWTARNGSIYHLGTTAKQTAFAWYSMRNRLRERPAGGVVGPSELDDIFTVGGYTNAVWPQLAGAWSAYVREGDVDGLLNAYNQHAKNDAEDENGYAVYLGVQCSDAAWPRDWARWHADMAPLHRKAPFMTWSNAWYNAPCAFWGVRGGTPVTIKASKELPPILMLQSRHDAATPYAGAVNMSKLFPSARMVVEPGGNHGISLIGNKCVDRVLVDYLKDASLPQRLTCTGLPDPRAARRMASGGAVGHERLTELIGR
ncbi:alpha/beta hydrolase [Nonomuraea sp. NPDC050556]|uniref:alpha/beta hydrolase n=1 Tax=Nonomuraea sp. NPDC050556 TaxID=3364369 RepID=UPI0037ADB702